MRAFFDFIIQGMKSLFIWMIQNTQETRLILPLEYVLGLIPENLETLSVAEYGVLMKFQTETGLSTLKRNPIVKAMLGLTGDGKSWIAKKLAKEHEAILISSDEIRVALLEANCTYRNVNVIIRRLLIHALNQNQSVILDSHYVAPPKRGSLNRLLKKRGLVAEYVLVIANPQEALQWIKDASYDGTIYNPFLLNPKSKPGIPSGWRLKEAERQRHYAWHYNKDDKPRKFYFPHQTIWNTAKVVPIP